jgi:ferric-dicitrate binding protein FerR (iron transport regulator)
MTNEAHSWLVDRYRACVEEVPASNLDQTILAAARQQSAVRRFARRARVAFFVTAVAAIAIGLTWRSHQLSVAQTRVADYGKSEGATRSYLLNATTPPYSGAGITEGTP